MSALPVVSHAPSSSASPLPASLEWLEQDLRERLAQAAGKAGIDLQATCRRWLLEGLERLEAEQSAAEAAGRCSLRIGSCTTGPVPLPMQQ